MGYSAPFDATDLLSAFGLQAQPLDITTLDAATEVDSSDATTPLNMFEGTHVSEGILQTATAYVIIDLGALYYINKMRGYGHGTNNNDGETALYMWDAINRTWSEKMALATRGESWSDYESCTAFVGRYLKVANTIKDSNVNGNRWYALDIIGDGVF